MSQTPIDSGFGSHNTAADVAKGIDLTGKVALFTGGYVALGLRQRKRFPPRVPRFLSGCARPRRLLPILRD
jgi:hypothetical protein